jgi:hypothetical protein
MHSTTQQWTAIQPQVSDMDNMVKMELEKMEEMDKMDKSEIRCAELWDFGALRWLTGGPGIEQGLTGRCFFPPLGSSFRPHCDLWWLASGKSAAPAHNGNGVRRHKGGIQPQAQGTDHQLRIGSEQNGENALSVNGEVGTFLV